MTADFIRGLRAASNYLRHAATHSDNAANLHRKQLSEFPFNALDAKYLHELQSIGTALALHADEVDNLCESDFTEDVFHAIPVEGELIRTSVGCGFSGSRSPKKAVVRDDIEIPVFLDKSA